ncbi:MAG: (Fe-S)-binding protein [Desulfarculaceae bacterium]|nr:(Fe-S)-binding protein [Desulfarculaceae bacterium]
MFNPTDIIDILANNVKKTRGPFGIPKFITNRWWKTEEIPEKGEYLLFTGLMYQLAPFIETSTRHLERFEDTRWADEIRFARFVPPRLSGTGLAAMTPIFKQKQAQKALKDITRLLKTSGTDFFYRPQLDEYSGILLYDMGDRQGFADHARYVAENLTKAGVKKIITVDPHTTYALKVLYPEYTGETFEVIPYFELLALESKTADLEVTLHDPCFFGRYLEVSDVPRAVLSNLGIRTSNLRNDQVFTSCCGGPAESVSPALSRSIMEERKKELETPGHPIVAMCPVCAGNLKRSGAQVEDLSAVLARHV